MTTPTLDLSEFRLDGTAGKVVYAWHLPCEAGGISVATLADAVTWAQSHVCPDQRREREARNATPA